MKIFIFRVGDDYISAHKTVEGVAKEICGLCEEDEEIYPDPKELVESIKARHGYVELLDHEKFGIPDDYSVMEAILEK